jgi:hypothetical protein
MSEANALRLAIVAGAGDCVLTPDEAATLMGVSPSWLRCLGRAARERRWNEVPQVAVLGLRPRSPLDSHPGVRVNALAARQEGLRVDLRPDAARRLVQRSTGTNVAGGRASMRKMCNELKDRAQASGNWSMLDAIYKNKLKLKDAYPYFVGNRLAELEAKLSAKNLSDASRRLDCVGPRRAA